MPQHQRDTAPMGGGGVKVTMQSLLPKVVAAGRRKELKRKELKRKELKRKDMYNGGAMKKGGFGVWRRNASASVSEGFIDKQRMNVGR